MSSTLNFFDDPTTYSQLLENDLPFDFDVFYIDGQSYLLDNPITSLSPSRGYEGVPPTTPQHEISKNPAPPKKPKKVKKKGVRGRKGKKMAKGKNEKVSKPKGGRRVPQKDMRKEELLGQARDLAQAILHRIENDFPSMDSSGLECIEFGRVAYNLSCTLKNRLYFAAKAL